MRDVDRPAILHVNRVGFFGGVERVILTLAVGLKLHGFQASLACPAGELARAAEYRGISVMLCRFVRMRATLNPLLLASYPIAWIKGSLQVLSSCQKHDVKLIHAHHPVGVLYAAAAKRRLRIPLILHVHEVLPAHWFYRLALRLAAKNVDRFVCVSEAGRALVEDVLRVDASRVSVVHNGVDPSFLEAPAGRLPDDVRSKGPHIGVFGVIEPRKGQDVFLKAACRVAAVQSDAQFWVVGPVALADKAQFARDLERTAAQPPLAGRVHFVGFQQNVRDWMQAMDVVVLASVAHESLSMVLLEALTLGRPTVGTTVGGGSEIISNGVTGRIVAPGDNEALAGAIEYLLTPEGRRLGLNAAEDAHRRFGSERFCSRISELYRDMLGAAAKGV